MGLFQFTRIDITFVGKFGWDWQNDTNKATCIVYGGSLIVKPKN